VSRHRARAVLVTAAVLSAVLAVAGCGGKASPPAGRSSGPAGAAHCGVRAGDFLPVASLPRYTRFLALDQKSLPVQSHPGHPLPYEKRYVCGQFHGYLTDLALTGKYRQQDNKRARGLGYLPGKWPLVPLTGSIVSQQGHSVLEIYEGVYEFGSPASATAYLHTASGGGRSDVTAGLALRLQPRALPVHPAPGAVVTERLLGPQQAVDEHVIFVGLRISDYVVTLSFQGGQSLNWHDVSADWQAAKNQLTAISNGSSQ
jgi:hypothetical protein